MLHIIKIKKYDVLNGPGIRCSIWLAGCNNKCPHCWASDTWNPLNGKSYDELRDELVEAINNPLNEGVSILGGDPLYHFFNNGDGCDGVLDLLNICKEAKKKVWLWSGYEYERIQKEHPEVLQYIDVLIDGKFDNSKKDLKLFYRGSSNQRVIDVPKTLESGTITLFERLF